MSNLAYNLGFSLGGVPVVDVTGLTDAYDLVLPYDPPVATLSDVPSSFPSILKALQAVGLNFEAEKNASGCSGSGSDSANALRKLIYCAASPHHCGDVTPRAPPGWQMSIAPTRLVIRFALVVGSPH